MYDCCCLLSFYKARNITSSISISLITKMGKKTHPTLFCSYFIFVFWDRFADKHMSLGDNLKELGRAMAGIGETESEGSGDLDFFSIEQAKAVIDYLNIRYFCRICYFLFEKFSVVGNWLIK